MHFAKAIYDYTPRDTDEIPLEEDDIIQILSTDAKDGWYYGQSNTLFGFFPQSYVTFLTPEQIELEGLPSLSSSSNSNLLRQTSVPELDVSVSVVEQQKENELENVGWFGKLKRGVFDKKKSLIADEAPLAPAPLSVIEPSKEDQQPLTRKLSHKLNSPVFINKAPTITPTSISEVSEPQSERPTTATPAAAAAQKPVISIVSMVGAHAAVKKGWVDSMGGVEVVAKLGLTKKEVQRQEVIYEVMTTEKDFVEDLSIVIELYIKGLKKQKIVRPKDMSVIFSNVEQLLPVNQMLLSWLEERTKDAKVVEQIGDIFIRVSDYLKMYTMYCSNHPYALMKLNSIRKDKKVALLLDQCASSPESRKLDLANFLLKPVQRICKYPLLVREIMKNTESTHPDSENLAKAFLKIETVVTIVNEGARQAESAYKMLEFQSKCTTKINIIAPSRILLRNAAIETIVNNEKKKREIYLFNDMMLITKPDGHDKLKLLTSLQFGDLTITTFPDTTGKENQFEICQPSTDLKFLFQTDSQFAKQQWLKSITESLENFEKRRIAVTKANNAAISPTNGTQKPDLETDEVDDDDLNFSTDSKQPKPTISESPSLSVINNLTNLTTPPPPPQPPILSSNDTPFPSHRPKTPTSIINNTDILRKKAEAKNPPPIPLRTNSKPNLDQSAHKALPPPTPPKRTSNLPPPLEAAPIKSLIASNPFIIKDQTKPAVPFGGGNRGRAVSEVPGGGGGDFLGTRKHSVSCQPCGGGVVSTTVVNDTNTVTMISTVKSIKYVIDEKKTKVCINNNDEGGGASKVSLDKATDRGSDQEVVEKTRKESSNKNKNGVSNGAVNVKKPVCTATITEVMKLSGKQTKDYTYIIKVTYIGGTGENILQHSYEDFFELHMQLLGHFPEEAGMTVNGEARVRIIPELPGQMMFVSESVAKGRVGLLQAYINGILVLPAKIRKSHVVLSFFNNF